MSSPLTVLQSMPIRFQCDGCHQRLSIARRKAGAQIVCPTCGQTQTVPRERRFGLIDSLVEKDSSSSGEIRPDLGAESLPDEAAIPVPPLLPAMKEAIDTAPSIRLVPKGPPQPTETPPPPPPPPVSRRPSPWAVYCQALILAAVGIGGFAAGYFLGRQDGSALPARLSLAAAAPATAPRDGFRDEEVLLQGRMLWMPTFAGGKNGSPATAFARRLWSPLPIGPPANRRTGGR